MPRVAFIGLGNMGLPMAANLAAAGHEVVGFDAAPAARDASTARGLSLAGSAAAAVAGADIVVTMLPHGEAVRAVWSEAVAAVAQGTLLIDSSTIDVASARAAHELARGAGLDSVDAPVSGGTEGATAATLTFMVGAEPPAFERARPILEIMGRRVVHCGGAGSGQAAKICNNMILGISMIAVSEAFNLADGIGLSRQALFDVASTASGQCFALTSHCPVPGPVPTSAANRDYRPGFAADLMLKDLDLAQTAATGGSVASPLGGAAAEIFRRFVAGGGRGRDYSAVIDYLRGLPRATP